jgi:hypothetical protein
MLQIRRPSVTPQPNDAPRAATAPAVTRRKPSVTSVPPTSHAAPPQMYPHHAATTMTADYNQSPLTLTTRQPRSPHYRGITFHYRKITGSVIVPRPSARTRSPVGAALLGLPSPAAPICAGSPCTRRRLPCAPRGDVCADHNHEPEPPRQLQPLGRITDLESLAHHAATLASLLRRRASTAPARPPARHRAPVAGQPVPHRKASKPALTSLPARALPAPRGRREGRAGRLTQRVLPSKNLHLGCRANSSAEERRPYKAVVAGSNPASPTENLNDSGAVVKLVITPACHAGGRGFKSRPLRPLN